MFLPADSDSRDRLLMFLAVMTMAAFLFVANAVFGTGWTTRLADFPQPDAATFIPGMSETGTAVRQFGDRR